jgi:nucleoside-diphosphate-sugar epimerase
VAAEGAPRNLTVAVTGPTGEIGQAFVAALEAESSVDRILGMARRHFDTDERGWTKTQYRQGDVLDRAAVDDLVAEADVVVHLAFIIMGSAGDANEINLRGSRNVFEATVAAGRPRRLVHASSVAAYGFHDENPLPLTEDVPARGTDAFYYSRQKAEVERALAEATAGRDVGVYVFRPCIVAGPNARLLLDNLPYIKLSGRLPGAVRRLFDVVPALHPVLPDPGVPFQLVHHDDVAQALRAAVVGRGSPGIYNLAADGALTMSDLASALGWYTVPLPDLAVDATAEVVARLPFLPPDARWIEAFRVPVLMDTTKARTELAWTPEHDARETLQAMVAAARGGEPQRASQ